jgi:exocyst complex component 8
VYRTDSAAEKKNLLSQFRHVAEELAARRRKEREGEHERRKSLWASGGVRRPLHFLIRTSGFNLRDLTARNR